MYLLQGTKYVFIKDIKHLYKLFLFESLFNGISIELRIWGSDTAAATRRDRLSSDGTLDSRRLLGCVLFLLHSSQLLELFISLVPSCQETHVFSDVADDRGGSARVINKWQPA